MTSGGCREAALAGEPAHGGADVLEQRVHADRPAIRRLSNTGVIVPWGSRASRSLASGRVRIYKWTGDERQPDESGARREGGRCRRPPEDARGTDRRDCLGQHRGGAAQGREGRTPGLRQFPTPVPRAAPGTQPEDRHQPPAALEQVRPRVGRVDLVLDHVSQRGLDHLARVVRLLRRPVPERRAEAVRNGRDLLVLQQPRQRHVVQALAADARGRRAHRRRRQASASRRGCPERAGTVAPGARASSSFV